MSTLKNERCRCSEYILGNAGDSSSHCRFDDLEVSFVCEHLTVQPVGHLCKHKDNGMSLQKGHQITPYSVKKNVRGVCRWPRKWHPFPMHLLRPFHRVQCLDTCAPWCLSVEHTHDYCDV